MSVEADIEAEFVEYAEARGCIPLKLVIQGKRGWPDRTVLCPGGKILFLEFKRPDGKLSRQQQHYINLLRVKGFKIYVTYTVKDAARILDRILAGD